MHYYPNQKINILLFPCQHQVALTYNQTAQLLFIHELTTTEYILPHCFADVCLQHNNAYLSFNFIGTFLTGVILKQGQFVTLHYAHHCHLFLLPFMVHTTITNLPFLGLPVN